nr:LuxR C-terminal-related transcriptional regulator [Actinopolymorpha rutila]
MGRVRHPETLAQRELELLTLVARGDTNRQAAAAMYVSEATVKAWLQLIFDKLGARDRASAVAEAYRRGLLT